MKNYIAILLIFLFISNSLFGSESDTILINPGKSIDNIALLHSSRSDIKKYKKLKFTSSKGTGIACGTYGSCRFRWATYKNDSLGLTFEFRTSLAIWPFQIFRKIKLTQISIFGKASTTNGLVIGKSSRQDVINLYGLPAGWGNEGFIEYAEKGISFRFDDNGIVTEIEIFKPYSQSVF